MRRITWWIMSTLTALTLLLSYHTSTSSTPTAAVDLAEPVRSDSTQSVPTQSDSTQSVPTQSAPAPGSTDTGTGVSSAGTFTGSSVNTRWGPVQVQITVVDGKITAADAVVYPNENSKDVAINSRALPVLEQSTVAAQSANIDMVSGATVTSTGYIQSLQSAIDQANL